MAYLLSREAELEQLFEQQINQFWQEQAQAGRFSGKGGLQIDYVKLQAKPNNQQIIVVSPGRTETYLKYQELAFDLCRNGYDVLIIDHRGQGLSDRETPNRQVGDVADYQDFVADFAQLVEQQVLSQDYQQRYVLAHSMGGAIATLYLQQYQQHFNAVAYSAPMFSINLGGLPVWVAHTLARVLNYVNCHWGQGPRYAPGQRDYLPADFVGNELSHSKARYQRLVELYLARPEIQLGGPSNRWLKASFTAMDQIQLSTEQLQIPLLLLQAEQDKIVSPTGQNRFCEQLAAQRKQPVSDILKRIPGAKHEILFEADPMRDLALTLILDFFAGHRA